MELFKACEILVLGVIQMLDKNIVKDLNTIIEFLSIRDIDILSKEQLMKKYKIEQVDLLILVGNCIPYIAMEAAKVYKIGLAKKFMIAGGQGLTTQVLRDNINREYPCLNTIGRPEADIFGMCSIAYDIKLVSAI